MSDGPQSPVKEVWYAQYGYEPDIDGDNLPFRMKAKPRRTWTHYPSRRSDWLWNAYRWRGDQIQALVLVAHHGCGEILAERDDPAITLFKRMMQIEPITPGPLDISKLRLLIGNSYVIPGLNYMRYEGPQTPIVPLTEPDEFAQKLLPFGLGIELPHQMDPDFDIEKQWFVSYFPQEVTQPEFQQAYDRLHALHSWLAHSSHELYVAAKRLLSAHLSTLKKVSFLSKD